jgi:hypothetical protein
MILYLVTTFFWGNTGHFAYENLEEQIENLQRNVYNLKAHGKKLGYSVAALQSDPGAIIKKSRGHLFLRQGEGIIRLKGYSEKPRPLSPGTFVNARKEGIFRPEPYLRTLAAAAVIIVFLFYRPRREDS